MYIIFLKVQENLLEKSFYSCILYRNIFQTIKKQEKNYVKCRFAAL